MANGSGLKHVCQVFRSLPELGNMCARQIGDGRNSGFFLRSVGVNFDPIAIDLPYVTTMRRCQREPRIWMREVL